MGRTGRPAHRASRSVRAGFASIHVAERCVRPVVDVETPRSSPTSRRQASWTRRVRSSSNRGQHMSTQTEIVDAYIEGFRRSDKPAFLALLTDDVAWDLPGFRHLTGKADFEGEIVN